MTIDIRNLQNQRHVAGQRPDTEPADVRSRGATEDAGREESATGSDRVRLSPEARRLQALQESAQSTSEVDTAKVEQVRREIAEGRYHVDARKLASSILSLERELLG